MPLLKGSKPTFNREMVEKIHKKLETVGSRGLPIFIKAYESKEKYLKAVLKYRTDAISKAFRTKLEEKYNVDVADVDMECLQLDFTLLFWYGFLCADYAKDVDWDKNVESLFNETFSEEDFQ